MATGQGRTCSSCAYWQQYPNWVGVGVCDCPPSRNYDRMTIGTGGPCEYFAFAPRGGRTDTEARVSDNGRL